MPKDLPPLQRRPLCGRVFPWEKLQVTRLDSLLLQRRPLCWRVFPWGKLPVTRLGLLQLQPRLVCERASLWAKPRGTQPLKAMQQSQLPRLFSRLSYAPVSLVIRPDWATDPAQYKLRRIRLHKAELKFLWS